VIVNCPGCDAPHESIYSAAQHAWKSQGGEHSEFDELDSALVAVMQHNDVDSESTTVEEPDLVEDVDPATDQPATTDGGERQAPPAPDVDDDPDDQDDDGCPECGDDGVATDRLLERDDVPKQIAEYLSRNFDRFCPDCSTSDTTEAW